LRRKITIISALCLLVGATAAYGATALNDYSGTNNTFSKGAGTAKKPVGISFKQDLRAKNPDSTKAAFVLVNITSKFYGVKSQAVAGHFPTCSASKMVALKSDSFCPKASKFATGTVDAFLGDPTLTMSTRIPCHPGLDVFNAGGNKLWFLFTTSPTRTCAGLHTGDTAPYSGTVKQQGKWQVTNVPLPPDISTKVANQPNFYGSLVHEVLKWGKVTNKFKGKSYANNVSFACLKGKRPWEVDFTAVDGSGHRVTQKVTGKAAC
jgi:hypothetical protein